MKAIFLYSTLLLNTFAWTQNTFQIKGGIKDINKRAISGLVTFTVKDFSETIATDSLGNFNFKITGDKLYLKVEAEGYTNYESDFKITKDIYINIILKQNPKINEIIINEDRRKTLFKNEKSILKLNIPQLNELPSLTGTLDVSKMLQLTPGIQNSGDVNGYLYIRGGDAGHSIFKYNDVPVYGSTHLFGIFPYYNSFHLSELIYDKSNLNSANGNTLGAYVNTKSNILTNDKFSFQANLGLLASQFNIKLPFKKSMFSLSYRKTYMDEFFKLLDIKNDVNYDFQDVNFSSSHKINNKSSVIFDFMTSKDNLKYNSQELFADINLTWKNYIGTTQFNYKKNEKLKFFTNAYFSKSLSIMNIFQHDLSININASIVDFGLKNTINYNIYKIKSEAGLSYNNYSISPYNLNLSNFGFIPKTKYADTNSNLFSIFQDFNFFIVDNIHIKSGVRFNYFNHSNINKYSFEPKLGIYFNEKGSTNYYITLAQKNQHLSLVTTSSIGIPTDFWIASTNNIPFQKSKEVSFSINHHFNKNVILNFDFFYNEMKNVLIYPLALSQFNEASSIEKDIFIGNGKAYGLELLLKKENGKFKGWMSYTWSKSLRNFPDIDGGSSFYAKYDRRHNLSTTLTYSFTPKIIVGLTQIVSSGNRFTSSDQIYFINNVPVKEYNQYNKAQLPFYNRTDLSFNFWIIKNVQKESKITFSIYNLFNVKNPVYQSINFEKNEEQLSITKTDKVFYKIIPSINWYFKF
ncbi:TonB-dependent receptor plug domain-containing protein [Flavobacterium columnare]|nr:TonB-dependent receptor [Flavobacterium columnare]